MEEKIYSAKGMKHRVFVPFFSSEDAGWKRLQGNRAWKNEPGPGAKGRWV
jgi:hypothetical protein